MSRVGAAIDMWIAENALDGIALQCWTAIEQLYGIVPCALMSLLSSGGVPAACEVDITGTLSMLALQAATRIPSAIVDWNNNYGGDPDKCVVFHCSNLPRDVFKSCTMSFQAIIAGDIGKENAFGSIEGRIRNAPATFCRISTDDTAGAIRAYLGEGRFTDDPLDTFGGYGVLEVPGLQSLLHNICRMGFEHHVAVNLAHCAEALCDAMTAYLGYDVYHHA
ncbi:MAG: L-fucose/L-arabinose isomerase family protein [Planctomycetota bacterium]|jgi:L-fucose isomerase-like protein